MAFGVIGRGTTGSTGTASNGVGNLGAPATAQASRQRQSAGLDTMDFKVGPSLGNVVVQCPAFRVPAGKKVQIIGPSTNSNAVLVSETRESVAPGGSGAVQVPSGLVIDYPVDNTGRLFFYLSTNTDYVIVRIIGGQ